MLQDADLVAFVGATDLERARAFYADKLGLPVIEVTPIALVLDCHGTTLRVTRTDSVAGAGYTVLGWTVEHLRDTLEDLRHNGVSARQYDRLDQSDLGIWRSPSGARVAWITDPDGNVLSLTER